MSLFAELRRRNVFKVTVAYIVVAWLILQVADVVLGNIDAPPWVFQALMLFLAFGLVLSIFFAWAFELTPEGIKRESEVDRTRSITRRTGRKLDFTIIALLVVAVAFLLVDRMRGGGGEEETITASINSIAVLPFANRSAVADDIYFVDGIQDDILTQLANMSGIDKVISRTSVERYRGTELSMTEIGEQLGVGAILEGGVQRSGDRVRINVQLIDAADDVHLWAETYEREATAESLFTVQSEISREVAAALHIVLTREDEEQLGRIPTDNLEAYSEFVLGQKEMALRTGESLEIALGHFERAVELDPDYALAHVGKADVLALMSEYSGLSPEPMFEHRQEVIDTAIGLDPTSGEAYAALALLQQHRSGIARMNNQQEDADEFLDAAEASFLKSMELSPNYPASHHWYSNLINTDERREESLRYIRRALELDPAAPVLTSNLVNRLQLLGRLEEARQVLLDALALDPSFATYYARMAMILYVEGRVGEAAAWMDRATQLNPTDLNNRFGACQLQIDLDDPVSARACLDRLREDFPEAPAFAFLALDVFVLWSSNGAQAAVDYAEAKAEEFDEPAFDLVLAAAYLLNTEYDKARPFYEERYPQYFSDEEIELTPSEVANALNAATSMWTGERFSERAQYIAAEALETMESMHRTRGVSKGSMDGVAHTILGNREQTIAAFREAIDSGWRTGWWQLRSPIVSDAMPNMEIQAMIAERKNYHG